MKWPPWFPPTLQTGPGSQLAEAEVDSNLGPAESRTHALVHLSMLSELHPHSAAPLHTRGSFSSCFHPPCPCCSHLDQRGSLSPGGGSPPILPSESWCHVVIPKSSLFQPLSWPEPRGPSVLLAWHPRLRQEPWSVWLACFASSSAARGVSGCCVHSPPLCPTRLHPVTPVSSSVQPGPWPLSFLWTQLPLPVLFTL